MSKQRTSEGGKNLISTRLRESRKEKGFSIRGMANELKEHGYKMDRNVIYRIENNERYVTDMEIKAFVEVLGVDYGYLIEGKKES
jgi:transcriptional regulator with XRE-family HTH domain